MIHNPFCPSVQPASLLADSYAERTYFLRLTMFPAASGPLHILFPTLRTLLHLILLFASSIPILDSSLYIFFLLQEALLAYLPSPRLELMSTLIAKLLKVTSHSGWCAVAFSKCVLSA